MSEQSQSLTLNFNGMKKNANVKAVKRVSLDSDKLYEDNSIDAPTNIVPVEKPFTGSGKSLQAQIEPLSFSIYVISAE